MDCCWGPRLAGRVAVLPSVVNNDGWWPDNNGEAVNEDRDDSLTGSLFEFPVPVSGSLEGGMRVEAGRTVRQKMYQRVSRRPRAI